MIELSHNELVHKALELDGNPEKVGEFYDGWAKDYKADTDHIRYEGPATIAELLVKHVDPNASIVDAGCGTGFVGQELSKRKYYNVYGFDLSREMAKIARETHCYNEVIGGVDIMEAIGMYADEVFDAAVSVGVFTLGHVPPEALNVLVDLVFPGGIVIVSIRDLYNERTNIGQIIDNLVENEKVEVLERIVGAPYSIDGAADYWIFKKN